MKPDNTVLSILAKICSKLAASGKLPAESAKEARDYYFEWGELSTRYGSQVSNPQMNLQMEAQASDLALNMAQLIEKWIAS